MKKEIIKGFVKSKEQLKNSVVGGPCVRIHFETVEGREIVGKTASNSSAGYCLSCSMAYLEDRLLELEIHETAKGSIIITRILSGYYGA